MFLKINIFYILMSEYFTVNKLTNEYIKSNFTMLFLVFLTSLFILIKGVAFPIYLGKLIPSIKNGSKSVLPLFIKTISIL